MELDEWPIAAPAADRAVDPVRSAGSVRLDTVRRDFFLDQRTRLSEQERALMAAMLDDLVVTIADELISGLADGLDTISVEGHDALVARLRASGLLDRPALVSLLLRRADEQRLASSLQLRRQPGTSPLIQRWIADDDGELAARAMALVVARGRRRDRYGQGRLLFDDLSAEEAAALVHAVAAGIRQPLPALPAIDRALVAGAETLLARHNEVERIDFLLAELVRMLEQSGRLDDMLIVAAAGEGETSLLSAILARRGGISGECSWDHLIAGSGGRLVLLARMAGLGRATAARLVADLGELTGIVDPAAEMIFFDSLSEESVEDRRSEWRLPLAYRDAQRMLGNG